MPTVLRGAVILIGPIVVSAVLTAHDIGRDQRHSTAAAVSQSPERRVGPGVGNSIAVDSPIFTQTDFSAGPTITKTAASLKFVCPIETPDRDDGPTLRHA